MSQRPSRLPQVPTSPRGTGGSLMAAALLALALPATGAGIPVAAPGAEPVVAPGEARSCTTPATCEARLRALVARGDRDGSLDEDTIEVVDRLATMPDAVPMLVGLLADPDEAVADTAAAALRDTPTIEPQYLPQIVAGLDRGLGWLAPALARIEGDEPARLAVAYFLVSDSAPHNQEAYALELLGARALPHIVAAARCSRGCPEDTHRLLGAALAGIGIVAQDAAPELFAIAADPDTPVPVAAGVLHMLGEMGPAAAGLVEELVALRTANPALRAPADTAIAGTREPEAAEILAARLAARADLVDLMELGALGGNGRVAGPQVEALLADPDPDARVAAARTLGLIDYGGAIPALRTALHDPRDLRLAWAASEALGRLRAVAARQDLAEVARSHPYPPVRAKAAEALAGLDAPPPPPPRVERGRPVDFIPYATIDFALPACTGPALVAIRPDADRLDAARAQDGEVLETLAYDRYEPGYQAGDGPEARAVRTVPTVALRVPDGWLVGSDRGEWGGELMFIAPGASPRKLHDRNVADLHRLDGRIVAVVGLAHLGSSRGALLDITRDADGHWRAAFWRGLPGAPMRSWKTAEGELLIDTHRGGTVLFNAQGDLRMAPCD